MVVMMVAFLLNDELSGSRLRRVDLRRVGLGVGLAGHYNNFLDSGVMVVSVFLYNHSGRSSIWLSGNNDFLDSGVMMMTAFFNYHGGLRWVGLGRVARLSRVVARLSWVSRLRWIAGLGVSWLGIRLRRVWLGRISLRHSTRHRNVDMQLTSRSSSIVQRNPFLEEPSPEHMEVEVSLSHKVIGTDTVSIIHKEADRLLSSSH